MTESSVFFSFRKGEYSIKEAIIVMFKCRSFYILWLTILCMECSLQYCNGLYKVGVKTIFPASIFDAEGAHILLSASPFKLSQFLYSLAHNILYGASLQY